MENNNKAAVELDKSPDSSNHAFQTSGEEDNLPNVPFDDQKVNCFEEPVSGLNTNVSNTPCLSLRNVTTKLCEETELCEDVLPSTKLSAYGLPENERALCDIKSQASGIVATTASALFREQSITYQHINMCELEPASNNSVFSDNPISIKNVNDSKIALDSKISSSILEEASSSKPQLKTDNCGLDNRDLDAKDSLCGTQNSALQEQINLEVSSTSLDTPIINNPAIFCHTPFKNALEPMKSVTANIVTFQPMEHEQSSSAASKEPEVSSSVKVIPIVDASSKRQLQLDLLDNQNDLQMNIDNKDLKPDIATIDASPVETIPSTVTENASPIETTDPNPNSVEDPIPTLDDENVIECAHSKLMIPSTSFKSRNNLSPRPSVPIKLSALLQQEASNSNLLELSVEKQDVTSLEEQDTKPSEPLDDVITDIPSEKLKAPEIKLKKCFKCGKLITDKYICALGKMWHVEHFTCSVCSTKLTNGMFYENKGQLYCRADYINRFHPKCEKCQQSIEDKYVAALDKTWHVEHFNCEFCGAVLGLEGYFEMGGKPYCAKDYSELFAPKCHACKLGIMDICLSALNYLWHPECFICKDCKTPIFGDTFFQVRGKPICPSCANDANIKIKQKKKVAQ